MLYYTTGTVGGAVVLALVCFLVWFFFIKGRDSDSKDGDSQFISKPPQASYQKQGSANSNGDYSDVGAVRDVTPGAYVAGAPMVSIGVDYLGWCRAMPLCAWRTALP